MFDTQSKPIDRETPDQSFPKTFRILRSRDYRNVYGNGSRVSGAYFLAFCLARESGEGPRVGLTVPRAIGKAVDRNRIKRRMREAIRMGIRKLPPVWDIVFNPRRSVLKAPVEDLEREVERVFNKCKAS